MNESSRLSDGEVTDMLRRRSARPAPSGLASAILESLASERARHPARTPGRSAKRPLMLLAAAALLLGGGALAAGSGALRLWSITPPGPAPSLGLVDFPSLTTTFVSPRNGFSVKHPNGAGLTPATDLWDPGSSCYGSLQKGCDGVDVVETGLAAVFQGASAQIPNGVSIDEWVDDSISPGGCGAPRSQQAPITIGGQSGRISECPGEPGEIVATVAAGGRLYKFTLLHARTDARAVFDLFAATIDLTAETAVDYPGLTTTFVSPTNGFSFGYIDRGGLKPAKELWDPVTQPRPDFSGAHDDPFDGVETGSAAYFKAASTAIPDGVSIDAWVDEYVTPVGCAPRSHQAEITIDGQSGRIAECPNEIEATVVAGGRLYLFILLHDRGDARAFFDAFAATIDLRPGDAAVPSSSPSP